MITVSSLAKRFGNLKTLDGISLSCDAGEVISMIGPNGSGKTTLIKCILGMVKPDRGSIKIDGKDVSGDWEYRRRIGYMPQIGRFPDNMTIRQVFDMMKDLRKDSGNELDEELLHDFGLPSLMEKRMRTLSGGTRQKVSAALAFLFRPEILILDEPTGGLDPLSSELLKQKIVQEKERGRLILMTSHILSDLDDMVTDVIYLQEGKLKFHKSFLQLQMETDEEKLSKAIAVIMKNNG